MLTNIKIEELYAHPQNPRKDIGDITELVESIKNQGVFQNLTVIEGGPGVPTGASGYTVIIGHRRMAAAKKAGLKELPCLVAQMDEKQQVATMLLENMQRSDLSVYEQAQGFQMMLDLGETQQSIAEKTGFSQTTVYRRLELAKLDQKKLEEASQRQISISDLDKLNQVESIEKRNELLKVIGTSNFQYSVKNAVENEKRDKEEKIWRKTLLDAGLIEIEDQWNSKYEYCKRTYLTCSANAEEYVRADDEKYFRISYGSIYFRKDRTQKKKTKEEIENEKRQERIQNRRKQLEDMAESTYQLRKQFIDVVSSTCVKKHFADIVSFFYYMAVLDELYSDSDEILELFNTDFSDESYDNDDEYNKEMSKALKKVGKTVEEKPEKYLWKMLMHCFKDSKKQNFYAWYSAEYEENLLLKAFYELLVKMGYQISDDEKQLIDGTHPIFTAGE